MDYSLLIRKDTRTSPDLPNPKRSLSTITCEQTRVTKAGGWKRRTKKGPYSMSHAMLLSLNLQKHVHVHKIAKN